MPLAARVLIGPALIALTRMSSGPRSLARYLHAGFQRRLGHAHHVVVRHDLLRAVIAQRQDRAAARASSPPRAGSPRPGCRRRCSSSSGSCRGWCRRIARAARSCRKSRSRGPRSRSSSQRSFSVANAASSAAMSDTSQSKQKSLPRLLGERAHALLQRLALVGEGQLGAVLGAASGRSPRRATCRWRGP